MCFMFDMLQDEGAQDGTFTQSEVAGVSGVGQSDLKADVGAKFEQPEERAESSSDVQSVGSYTEGDSSLDEFADSSDSEVARVTKEMRQSTLSWVRCSYCVSLYESLCYFMTCWYWLLQKDLYYEKKAELESAIRTLDEIRDTVNQHIVEKALHLVSERLKPLALASASGR